MAALSSGDHRPIGSVRRHGRWRHHRHIRALCCHCNPAIDERRKLAGGRGAAAIFRCRYHVRFREDVANVGHGGLDTAEALAVLDSPQRNPGYAPKMPALWRLTIAARIKPSRETGDAAAALAVRAETKGSRQDRFEILQDLVILGKLDLAYDLAMRLPPLATNWGFVWFRGFMAPFRADRRFIAFADRQGLLAYWRRTGRWPDFCRDEKLPYRCA